MSCMSLAPLSVVGLEGVYGTALMLGLVLPAAQLLPGREGGGIHEDTWESLHMLAGSAALRWAAGLTLLAVAVYNVVGECPLAAGCGGPQSGVWWPAASQQVPPMLRCQ